MDSVSNETPTQGEIREIKLRCRFNNTSLLFSKFRYYSHLLQLLKHQSLAGKKSKRQTENVRFALVTRVSIPQLSVVSKCPHVLRVPKHLQNILPYHFVKEWSVCEQIPTKTPFLETPMHRGYICAFTTWQMETGVSPQQTTGRPWRLIIMLVNLFCSVKKPSQWVSVCCERTPNTIYGSTVYRAKTTKSCNDAN